jgi:glutathione synthase/RimK-type ligase-like ATP-grasp enzyme
MKIAINNRKGSFSDRWITYCINNKISYKLVNCYDSDIVTQLSDCDGLMWHWSQDDYKAQNFARQLIVSIEKMGINVFPNSNNCWHFDDKLGQKYLLESIGAPMVPSYAFYDKITAFEWIDKTSFPKVFKLRGGASSVNVKLIKSKQQARKLVRQSFGRGFPFISRYDSLKDRFWRLKRDKDYSSIVHVAKGFARLFIPSEGSTLLPRQKGYVYFQDFIPKNTFDDRIIIIGNRAIAVRRSVRKNDFRASGSGIKSYKPEQFNSKSIRIAFDIANKLRTQSLAFDFIYDSKNNPYVVELSYCYVIGDFYDSCPGYWDSDLNWHDEAVNPQHFIIDDFIKSLSIDL